MPKTTPPEPTRRPGRPKDPELEQRRRREILVVASQVFASSGFAATDMQVIADKLGVGKGTIYRYFPNKEALFLAAVENGLKELTAELDKVFATWKGEPLGVLPLAIRTYFGFFHSRPEMAELFIQERAAFRDHHRPLYFVEDENERGRHSELLQRMIDAGQVRPLDHDQFFRVIGDLLYGTILANLLTGRPVDPDRQTDEVLQVILHGILTEPERARRPLSDSEQAERGDR